MRDKRAIVKRLKKIYRKMPNAKIIIFPYGNMGIMTEKIMHERFHKEPFCIIDNNKADNARIFPIDELSNNRCKDATLLMTSNSREYYKEVLEMAKEHFEEERIEVIFKIREKQSLKNNMIHPYGKEAFLFNIRNCKTTKLLDVGCGNNSANYVKSIATEIYYVGLDVGDYNQNSSSIGKMNEYDIVKPEDFASEIEKMADGFDAIISAHNIEHCNEPRRVVTAMAHALKKGGKLYMAFPSEKSAHNPSRGGTLNFYDDKSHVYLPEFDWIVNELKRCGLEIVHAKRTYRPLGLVIRGICNEKQSREENRVMDGTWALHGFESIIWAKKPD